MKGSRSCDFFSGGQLPAKKGFQSAGDPPDVSNGLHLPWVPLPKLVITDYQHRAASAILFAFAELAEVKMITVFDCFCRSGSR